MIANASHLRSHNGRRVIAVSAAAPEAELNYPRSPFIHDVAVGNARGRVGMMALRAGGLA